MKKASFISSTFKDDECFSLNSAHNRDNFLYFFYDLKKTFYDCGYDLSTGDINPPIESEFIIQLGLDFKYAYRDKRQKKYLILLESPHVDPSMMKTSLHNRFSKVFTWNDDLVDNKKYFKINYAYKFPKSIPKKWDKKLCCMIAGNKTSNHPMELYSERLKLIKWYQQNHPNKFDLYGTQWNEFYFGHSLIARLINKLVFFKISKLSFYRGGIKSKHNTLKKYRFSVCYENIKDQNGYVTEKIFDSFFSGCVPIYLGAKNITSCIPKKCFIDRRDFNSCKDVYEFINGMDEDTYMGYLNSIEDFLNSKGSEPYQSKTFSNTIKSVIIKDLLCDFS